MIIKSYEIQKNKDNFLKFFFFLIYGENLGLKKDIKELIKNEVNKRDQNTEVISLYENEILDNEENFYNIIYSGSLFSKTKIVTVYEATDKSISKINDIYNKIPQNTYLIIFAGSLEKKSKLRNFFEKEKTVICIPCYLDSERDLENIASYELNKNNIVISRESINLLIEKSNSDRNNLKNEIEKIKCYSMNKKNIKFHEISHLINFAGDYKSDNLINDCLCGNINQYKKILSEIYTGAINQILLLRILTNKIQRLLKIKGQISKSVSLDSIISSTKPPIFWKEKPIIKKQLSIWKLDELRELIAEINNTELLCKKNPYLSKTIFFNFFSKICKKANNYSL